MSHPNKPQHNDHSADDEHTPMDTKDVSRARPVSRDPGLSTTLGVRWGIGNKKPPGEAE